MAQEEASGRLNLYDDVSPLENTQNVNVLLEGIRKKTRGADVREAIARLIEVTFKTATKEGNANLEVAKARGVFETLSERLKGTDSNLANVVKELAQVDGRIDNLVANAGNGSVPSELTDMRVTADGSMYNTASTALRAIEGKISASLEKYQVSLPTFNDGTFLQYTDGRVGSLGDLQTATTTANFVDVVNYDSIMVSDFAWTKDNNAGLAFFDQTNTFITGYQYSNFKDKVLNVPYNARSIKFSVPTTSKSTVKLYGFKSEDVLHEMANLSLLNEKDSVSEYNASFITKSKNLYNSKTVEKGKYVRGADGTLADNATFSVSDYIPVEPNQIYTKNFVNQGSFYDVQKRFISGFDGYSVNIAQSKQTMTAPENARYMRISIANSQVSLTQVEEGAEMTPLDSFGYKIKESLLPNFGSSVNYSKNISNDLVNATSTVKIKLIGDSITHGYGGTGYAQDGEQIIAGGRWNVNTKGYCWANLLKKDLESRFDCSVTNYGCSGAASLDLVAGISDIIKDDDDIVICQIGTNNRGEGNSQRFSSLSGDLEMLYQYCKSRDIKFIPMIAPPAAPSNEASKDQHMEDVAHVISSFAERNGLEYINNFRFYSEYCEIKGIPVDSLLMDHLHPSDKGYELLYRNITRNLGLDPKISDATW